MGARGGKFNVAGEGEEGHSYGKCSSTFAQRDGIGDDFFGWVYKGLSRVLLSGESQFWQSLES